MPKEQPATKVCRACGEEKPWGDFYGTLPGYTKSVCKPCDNAKACERVKRRAMGVTPDEDPTSYKAIGRVMRIPADTVRQIEARAMRKFRLRAIAAGLRL
jgi:hypothetical protein